MKKHQRIWSKKVLKVIETAKIAVIIEAPEQIDDLLKRHIQRIEHNNLIHHIRA